MRYNHSPNKLKQKFPETTTCCSVNHQQVSRFFLSGLLDLCFNFIYLTQKENIPEYKHKGPEKLQLCLSGPVVKYSPLFPYRHDGSFRKKACCFYSKIVPFQHGIMHRAIICLSGNIHSISIYLQISETISKDMNGNLSYVQ